MLELIGDDIEVEVRFSRGKVRPFRFLWRGQPHAVREVTYQWQDRAGRALLTYFSVTDGVNLFEICFNSETLRWKLTKVCMDG